MNDTEVRMAAVREYVADPGNWSTLDGRRQHLLNLIDGAVARAHALTGCWCGEHHAPGAFL